MPAQKTFNRSRVLAGILLIVSLFLPHYAVPTSWSGGLQSHYVWDIVRGDALGFVFLMTVYAGPALIVLLHRRRLTHLGSLVLALSEPIMLGLSAALLFTVANSALTLLPLFGPWMLVPVSATIGLGAWMALFADGLLLVLWVGSLRWRLFRPATSIA